MTVKEWDAADQPREKLMALGPRALSDAELFAILLGMGTTEMPVVELARHVLRLNGNNLHTLERKSVAQLCETKGIGPAKAVTIKAACELAHRYAQEKARENPRVEDSSQAAEYFQNIFGNAIDEEVYVMFLNPQLCITGHALVSKGGVASAAVDVRVILREAILAGATRIILCHNHPSGNVRPSRADDKLTESVKQAAQTINIPLADHIIISSHDYYSYNDNGKI